MYKITDKPLILASTSPRRIEMLKSLGISFEQREPLCDESILSGEDPESLVKRLSQAKAQSISQSATDRYIVGADTVVFLNGQILGKPRDINEAKEMLGLIQGNTHVVWGAFAVINKSRGLSVVRETHSKVKIRQMSNDEIDRYIETKEPMDKAGAYAIQGIGASLVEDVTGSYTNVVGLDLAKLINTLIESGAIA